MWAKCLKEKTQNRGSLSFHTISFLYRATCLNLLSFDTWKEEMQQGLGSHTSSTVFCQERLPQVFLKSSPSGYSILWFYIWVGFVFGLFHFKVTARTFKYYLCLKLKTKLIVYDSYCSLVISLWKSSATPHFSNKVIEMSCSPAF